MAACCMSAELKAQTRVNSDIERQLKREHRQALLEKEHQTSFLFLGPSGSGKSTFIKQLRYLYGNGYTETERRALIINIHRTILSAIQALVEAMETLNIQYITSDLRESSKDLFQVNPDTAVSISHTHSQLIQSLWADPGLQKCYERRREFQLSDSAKYFLDNLPRIRLDGYLPTTQDVLRVRVPTTGINEYKFSRNINNKTLFYRLLEVETLSTTYRQWLKYFDNISVLLFVVPLSDYDRVVEQERIGAVNGLMERLELFRSIVDCTDFHCTLMVVVFNKMDEFEKKIKKSDLAAYCPDYTGPAQDPVQAREFIAKLFKQYEPLQEHDSCLFTCALDSGSVGRVWEQIVARHRDAFLNQHLNDFELLV